MKQIPITQNAVVLRTAFSDSAAWDAICAAIRRPILFRASVEFVSDPEYDGVTAEQLSSLVPDGSTHSFMFVVDRTTLSHPDRPVLVLDLSDEPGRTFRVIPAEMWGIENNLSIGNMDFAEFADAVDGDGIFRGFPRG